MGAPAWVPATTWPRIDALVRADPGVLEELEAVSAVWDDDRRAALLESFARHGEAGMPLAAAFMCAVAEVLGT
jgi:hypothetical protein